MNDGRLEIAAGEDVLAALLAASGATITAVIAAPPSAAERAYIRAAVALAASRRAPATRINAVLAGTDAEAGAITGAVGFLKAAAATTGVTLEVD